MHTFSKEQQATITPSQALKILKEGNARFTNGCLDNRNLLQQAKMTAKGQHPYAVILSCIDSRTGVELIFDQGIGDVFSVRIAGNIINQDILGSLEFATKVAGAKLIVVLGHSNCGAVKGACDQVKMGNLTRLLSRLKPAVEAEKLTKKDRCSSNHAFVENVAAINVKQTVSAIEKKSKIIQSLIEQNQCDVVGGMYDVASGNVHFYS